LVRSLNLQSSLLGRSDEPHLSTFQGSSKVEAQEGRLSDFFMLADEVIPE